MNGNPSDLRVPLTSYTDLREENGKMLPMFAVKGMFNIMKARHQLWMGKCPNTLEAGGYSLTGIT